MHYIFFEGPWNKKSTYSLAFRQCLLNVVCCDFCITCTPTPTPAPSWWPLFISYKALKESNSEEVRLHSEEMGKLKWGWDWTQPGSQLHLAASAVLLGKCSDPEQQLLPAFLVAGSGTLQVEEATLCTLLWAASLPGQQAWAQLPLEIKVDVPMQFSPCLPCLFSGSFLPGEFLPLASLSVSPGHFWYVSLHQSEVKNMLQWTLGKECRIHWVSSSE